MRDIPPITIFIAILVGNGAAIHPFFEKIIEKCPLLDCFNNMGDPPKINQHEEPPSIENSFIQIEPKNVAMAGLTNYKENSCRGGKCKLQSTGQGYSLSGSVKGKQAKTGESGFGRCCDTLRLNAVDEEELRRKFEGLKEEDICGRRQAPLHPETLQELREPVVNSKYVDADPAAHPWLMGFYKYSASTDRTQRLCNGVLLYTGCPISSNVVLTTAKCTGMWQKEFPLAVSLADGIGETASMVIRQKYLRYDSKDGHLELVLLSESIPFINARPACLPKPSINRLNERGVIASVHGSETVIIKEAAVQFLPPVECEKQSKQDGLNVNSYFVQCSKFPSDDTNTNMAGTGDSFVVPRDQGGDVLSALTILGNEHIYYIPIGPKLQKIRQGIDQLAMMCPAN